MGDVVLPPHLMPPPVFTPPPPPRQPVASTSARPLFSRTPSATPTPALPSPSLDGTEVEAGEKPKPRRRKKVNPETKPPKRVRTGQVALGETARQARVAINKRRTVLDVAEPETPLIVRQLRLLEQEAAAIELRGDDEDPDLLERIAAARKACDTALKDYTDASTARGLVKRAKAQSEVIDKITVDYNRQWGQAMLEGQMLNAVHRVIYHRLVDLQSQQAKRVNERRAEEAKAAKEKSAAEPAATDGALPESAPSKEPAASEPIVIESDSDDDVAGMEWAADEMMQA